MIETPEEHLDFSRVPESKGIPPSLPLTGIVGVICIFAIAAFTVLTSGSGHVWPSPTSMRVNLGEMPK